MSGQEVLVYICPFWIKKLGGFLVSMFITKAPTHCPGVMVRNRCSEDVLGVVNLLYYVVFIRIFGFTSSLPHYGLNSLFPCPIPQFINT